MQVRGLLPMLLSWRHSRTVATRFSRRRAHDFPREEECTILTLDRTSTFEARSDGDQAKGKE